MGLSIPRALLLDFGGVVVHQQPVDSWARTTAADVHRLIGEDAIDQAQIERDLVDGQRAAGQMRDAMSRMRFPQEISQHEFVMELAAGDWPQATRRALEEHVEQIAYWVSYRRETRSPRPGIKDLLIWAKENQIPVVIVSNAQSGQVHRDWLADNGLTPYVKAELYSDEVNMRKPNPRFIELGARIAAAPVGDTWYVGDQIDRDVLCARRAGAGAAILMPIERTGKHQYAVNAEPDLVVDDPAELLAWLKKLHDQGGSA